MGSELSSVPLLGAPHVASSRHGAMDPACWEHRLQGVGHTSKSISHSLGRSLLAVPHSSCSQAHSNPPGLQLEHLKFPLAPIVWAQFSASTPRLLSLPPSLHLSLPCWLHPVGGTGMDALAKTPPSYQGGAPICKSTLLALQVPLATRHVEGEEMTVVVMEPSREC